MKSSDVAFYFSRRALSQELVINLFYRRDNPPEMWLALSSRGPPCTRDMYRVHRVIIKYIYTRIGDADSAVSICRSEQRREQRASLSPTWTDGGSNYLLHQMNPSNELFDGDLSNRYLNRMCKVGRNPGEQPRFGKLQLYRTSSPDFLVLLFWNKKQSLRWIN